MEEGLVEGVLDGVIQLAEGELGADEAVDGEGGEAEGGLAEVLGLAAEFHDAAGLDAQHGDFAVEAGIPAFFEVFEVNGKPCLRALRLPRSPSVMEISRFM